MREKRRTEEVPQWVRDFIIQKWEEEPGEKEEQASRDTYLLNPFSQDEVEAIRKGVLKLREEAALALAQENRKSWEAGQSQLLPDSGFSLNDDLMFETYLRQVNKVKRL